MSFTVYVRRAAELDVAKAQKWYEEQLVGLASDFHHEFALVLARLAETPFIYPAVYRNIRRAVLHRFPFLVWYHVVGFGRYCFGLHTRQSRPEQGSGSAAISTMPNKALKPTPGIAARFSRAQWRARLSFNVRRKKQNAQDNHFLLEPSTP